GVLGTLTGGFIINRIGGNDTVGATLKYMRLCVLLAWPIATIGPMLPSLWAELVFMGATIFLISSVNCLSSLPLQYLVPMHMRAQAIALHGMVCAMIGTGIGPVMAGALSDNLTMAQHPLSLGLTLMAGVILPTVAVLLHSIIKRRNFLETSAAVA
ncbi:MAG: hypothetical protein WEB93_02775, partial [Sphingomonadales bacterium]